MLHVAGKPVLGHILDSLKTLDIESVVLEEFVFITGDMEDHIVKFVKENYNFKAQYVKQHEMLGDGHAISLAKSRFNDKDDAIVVFVDTLFIKDIKKDIDNIGDAEGIVWTAKTDDPKRFGIVELKGHTIIGIEEKPEQPKSNQAIIGLYYFKNANKMFHYLEEVQKKNITSKGEFRLADAMALMIREGVKLKSATVDVWLDCGKPETLLETNKYLLEHGKHKVTPAFHTIINHPVYIEEGVVIENSVIGPNVSIAKGTKITNSIITDSIIGAEVMIENAILDQSLIGNKAEVAYTKKKLNIGDSTQILVSH